MIVPGYGGRFMYGSFSVRGFFVLVKSSPQKFISLFVVLTALIYCLIFHWSLFHGVTILPPIRTEGVCLVDRGVVVNLNGNLSF